MNQEQVQALPERTSETARCMYPQERRRCDEPVEVVVTTDRATLHFCIYHKAYAFTIVLINAMTRGRSEVFIPDFGRFEMKPTGARVDSPDEDEDEGAEENENKEKEG